MIAIYILAGFIVLVFLVYLLSRVQMKAWLKEIDNVFFEKIENYIIKIKKDDKN